MRHVKALARPVGTPFWAVGPKKLRAGEVDLRKPLDLESSGGLSLDCWLRLDDGKAKASWDCDPGVLEPGKLHHVAVVVDSGPGIVSFVVDGLLCDGGDARYYGWGRLPEPLGNLRGSGKLRIAPSLHGQLENLRVSQRPLRTSEAIAHFHAGP